MHLQLDSRPAIADVSADGLALRFAATPGLDVVATLAGTLSATGLRVVAEVLSASHRVHVFDDAGPVATEQVACVLGAPAEALPATARHLAGPWRMDFASSRPGFDETGLAQLASGLCRGAADEDAVVVSFPGHHDALTSVRLLADGWETWHLYPGTRPHAVRTRTSVALR